MNGDKYLKQRKKSLTEMRELVFKRSQISSEIRSIRKELNGWDNVLVNEGWK